MELITLTLILIMIELSLKSRLDYTRDKKLLLWYGRTKREYIIIY